MGLLLFVVMLQASYMQACQSGEASQRRAQLANQATEPRTKEREREKERELEYDADAML